MCASSRGYFKAHLEEAQSSARGPEDMSDTSLAIPVASAARYPGSERGRSPRLARLASPRSVENPRRFCKSCREDERRKAAQFSLQEVREQFIVGRAILRGILGRYLQVDPERVRFSYGPHGKPAIAPECGGEGISFNMSDSHGLAIYAVARGRQVGIDLERMRSDVPCERMAKRYFAEAELKAFLALPADQRQEGFFNCWTRKEAYLKAIGRGTFLPVEERRRVAGAGRTRGDPRDSG